ncbi:MarR family transcriptional regulator [Bacillus sp. AFS018417]|uniref:MarR family winged helix-turn-helix transcriptional regulator n=1 Tax=unclassified Bacillus (in: firmicutes) TaxID=185979 RepID=UPI000BF33B87|nr:MarR family transcriptional regulator [Bacillus sp. AFS018417]PEZ03931.1 MarR family transcriptional regulator [Bacillus sp. AFS018417]
MDINFLMKELHFMQQSYATLFSVVNKVQTRGDEYMEILTARQHMALIAIAHLPSESTTLINIAKKLGTTKQTANKLTTSLVKKGYVKTMPSKMDKRSINIEITPEGKKALIACSEKSTYFLADMFHDFTTDEIKTFWRLLQKLYRFDGEEQDGFEENANLEVEEQAQLNSDSYQEKVLAEFSKRRYGGANCE